MIWTKTLPSQSGYYWFKFIGLSISIGYFEVSSSRVYYLGNDGPVELYKEDEAWAWFSSEKIEEPIVGG